MLIRILLALAVFALIPSGIQAQEDKLESYCLNGYLKYMNTVSFDKIDSPWLIDNLIHNRLNFRWYFNENLTFVTDMRNRIIYGDYIKLIPGYSKMISKDDGFLDFLTQSVYSNSSSVLITNIDRLYAEFNSKNLTITAGRQRINWGQSFAWNPNDIFNSFSFFDFDYEERPGSDALRIQYFPSYTSALEGAIKIDKNNYVTAAGLYRFNAAGYDFQALTGILDTSDFAVGFGWAGSIKSIGFNGEATYFHPQKNPSDSLGVLIATIGFNYLFKNSMFLNIETIYNGYFSSISLSNFSNLYFLPPSVKTISFSKFTWFAQLSYPIHPLVNVSLAAMLFPSLSYGSFIMPSFSYSAGENLEVSVVGQRFSASFNNQNENMNMLFIRFKFSF